MLVRLTTRALHKLYIETKRFDVETRQMGHRAECDLCGEFVDFDRVFLTGRANHVTDSAGLTLTEFLLGSQTTYRLFT